MGLGFVLGALSVAQVLVFIATQWYVVVTLGPGAETDALFAGMAVPQLILAVLGGSMASVLVPLFAAGERDRFGEDAWSLTVAMAGLLGVLGGMLAWMAPWWAPRIAPGLNSAGAAMLVGVTRIHLLGMAFGGVVAVLCSCLHARRRFVWAEVSPVLSGLAGFSALVWALPRYGVEGAAWASVFRGALHVALLAPILGRFRRPVWRSQALVVAWQRARPLVAGAAYYKLDVVLDRLLSSMSPAGGLSLFYLGQQAYEIGQGVIGKAVVAPMVPVLAIKAGERSWVAFRHNYRRSLLLVGGVSVAGCLGVAVAGRPLLQTLIGYGGVNEQNISELWAILLCLSGTFVGGSIGNVLASAFYSKGDTVTPTRFGVVVFTIGIAMKITGFLWHGLLGLAVASSTYFVLAAIGLFVLLELQLARSHD